MNEDSDSINGISVGHLRSYVERIERLEEEKKAIAEDIKDLYTSLKGEGFDQKAVKEIIKLRKQEDHKRQEAEAIIALYKEALGM